MQELNLFRTQRFLPLFVTQFLGAFNDNVFKNALAILLTYRIAQLTGMNAQILVTLSAGIFILPFFLFSATAGQLADKFERSYLIKIIKCCEIFLMLLAAAGFYFYNVPVLMTVLFALGMHSTFFGPLKYAILPDHLSSNELIAGNGIIEAGTFLAILLGTILGGVFILVPHGENLISTIVISMAICGWISSWYIPKTHSQNPTLKVNYNFFQETFRLLKYSKQHKDIFRSILGISWFWLFGGTLLAEFPVFVKDVLHANSSVITLFLTMFSLGIAVGSLLCNRLLKGKIHATYVPLGVLGMTVFITDLCFAAGNFNHSSISSLISLREFLATLNGWRIICDLFALAVCGGIFTVPLYAILQHRSDETYRARIIASNNIVNALFMVAAALLVVIMLNLGFSVTQVFLSLAIGNTLVAVYICKLLPEFIVKNFFRGLLRLLYRVKVSGLENYHAAGERVVIIANHTSFIDALLLATFLPDKLTFAVNLSISKKWWVRLFLKLIDAYPMDPTNPMAIKSLIDFVKQDKRCVIFPEGRLTVTGTLMKIYEGPGLVTDKTNAKLLPIRIQGAQFTPFSRLRNKLRIRWFPKISITILPAQKINIAENIKGRLRRQKVGYQLYDMMTEMIFNSSGDTEKTLFESLLDAQKIHGAQHKIIEDINRDSLSYQKFIMQCFVLSSVVVKKTKPYEKVGVLLPNMVSNALTFFALQATHRTPALLNFTTGISNVLHACKTAEIKNIYTSRKFIRLAKLTEMVSALKENGINLVYLEDLLAGINLFAKLKGLVAVCFPKLSYRWLNYFNHSPVNSDAAAVILFTSGSEGTPKGVVLSHRNIQANRLQLSAVVDFTANDIVFNALPIFHSFGLTGGMLLPLLSGIKVFLYPSPLHYRIIPELSYDTNATILFGTDTFLSSYAKYANPYDFYSVRYVFAGAERLREETHKVWSQKFGVRILEGYGATETAPVIAMNTPMQNKLGTVGRIMPGIQHKIEVVPGIDNGGILAVRGPNIMKGYLLTDQPGVIIPPPDGWYETGDIVSIDDAGFVTIKGRVKRFAKIAGEMVSLTMVEQQICSLWSQSTHAVINIPDAKKGEQLILVTTYSGATRDAVAAHLRLNQIPEIAFPKNIVILEKLPILGTGKIDYVSIKKMLVEQYGDKVPVI